MYEHHSPRCRVALSWMFFVDSLVRSLLLSLPLPLALRAELAHRWWLASGRPAPRPEDGWL